MTRNRFRSYSSENRVSHDQAYNNVALFCQTFVTLIPAAGEQRQRMSLACICLVRHNRSMSTVAFIDTACASPPRRGGGKTRQQRSAQYTGAGFSTVSRIFCTFCTLGSLAACLAAFLRS